MIPQSMSNRHGLIAGTTGGGKSVTLMYLATQWVKSGVPVLLIDCKGDLHRVSRLVRTEALRPLTVPICEFTPSEFADLIGTTDAGAAALADIWRINDNCARMPVTLADMREALETARAAQLAPPATLAQIGRALSRVEADGIGRAMAAPVFLPNELLGDGRVCLLDARSAVVQPNMYRTMLQWLAGELLQWSDVGDSELRLVVLVDEAHLLFDLGTKKSSMLLTAMRMLRSRGVGMYFATQSPEDLPEKLLGLLGHKIIHALRVFTPHGRERARILGLEVGATVQQLAGLGTGECYASVLQDTGSPALWHGKIPAPQELVI